MLDFLVVQKLNSLWLLRAVSLDPLLQMFIIRLSLPPGTSYIHPLTTTNVIVTKIARPDTSITDNTRESSILKFMAMIT